MGLKTAKPANLKLRHFRRNYGLANAEGNLTGLTVAKTSREGICVTSVSFLLGDDWKSLWCRRKTGHLRALSDKDIDTFLNILNKSPEIIAYGFPDEDCISIWDD